jgi:hypothetical protein
MKVFNRSLRKYRTRNKFPKQNWIRLGKLESYLALVKKRINNKSKLINNTRPIWLERILLRVTKFKL